MVTALHHDLIVPAEAVSLFHRQGYYIAKNVLSSDEITQIREKFDRLAAEGKPAPFDLWNPVLDPEKTKKDPLLRYPRVMHPHRFDDFSKAMMLHPRVQQYIEAFFGEPAIAAQSMYYFKPPGARGQALHQDNFYLSVKPGTCMAAWTAIDPATPENGGLYVVPQTDSMPIVCPEAADESESWSTHLVKPPQGKKAIPATLEAGDTLFFNGNVIHGSGPNRSTTMWRRSFICHYIPKSSEYASRFYNPHYNFDGSEHIVPDNNDGGPCGKSWETKDPYGA